MNNYKEPLKTFYQTQFQMIDGGIRKRMTIFFKKVNFINDEGLIFLENNPVESFMFDKMESDFTMDPSDYIFEVLVYSSLETQIMIRSYQKVQDIFASLGGIGSVLMFLGYLIVICEKNFNLNKCVINQLYSFPNGKTEKTKVTDPIIELKTNRLKKVLQLSLGIPEMSSTPKISKKKKQWSQQLKLKKNLKLIRII